MSWINAFRLVTFATTILFSVIVISLSVGFIAIAEPAYFIFSAFSLAIGLISVLTVTLMFVIDNLRTKGSYFSSIIVEIVWASVLWILWLTSGSYATWKDHQIISIIPEESNCNFGSFGPGAGDDARGCHEIKAIAAFSFILWILLMGHTMILIVLGIRAHKNGQPPWTTSVRDVLYVSEKAVENPTQVVVASPSVPQSFPPPPQRTLPPLPRMG